MAWCRRASSSVPHTEGEVAQQHLTVFGPVRTVCDRSPMTVRGGGVPAKTTALIADVKNGSAASELRSRCVSLHHGSGLRTHRIQGCGTNVRATTRGLPSYRHPDHSKCAAVLEAVKDEPSVALTRHP